ncbi:MAG: sulfatase-like hydrolase/transferase, partial [Ilumatobacteraceae bacterium]|nr:sulfatase-like hydrolase/transferase [Ilumatobacteraceae bacterium]
YKQNTHEGGVHVPLVVHWPDGIKAKGELRHQFHSVNDIVPTIYEALGVTPPAVLRGFEQLPITGTSLKYSLNNGDAEPQKTVQFFENHGHRAIYAHGWKAVTRHTPNVPYEDDDWELYNLAVDRSECVNLASQMPEKLSELVELWWHEAEVHNGLPLDDRGVELFGGTIAERSPNRPDRHYTYYPPIARIPTAAGPGLGGRSWDMTVSLTRSVGDDGVLYSTGTENSGVSLFIQNNKLVFDYNYFGTHTIIDSTVDVPSGTSVVGIEFRRAKKDATVALLVNNQKVGELYIPAIMRMISSVGASIGRDEGSAISKRYADEFAFRGKIHRLDIQLLTENRAEASVNAQASQRETMGRQ